MNAKTPSQPEDVLQHTHNKQPLQLLLRAEVFITAHNMSALCRINNTVTVQFYRGNVKVYAEGVGKRKMTRNKKGSTSGEEDVLSVISWWSKVCGRLTEMEKYRRCSNHNITRLP